jgi:hypothetical protein
VPLEFHVPRDVGPQQDLVGQRWAAEPGMQFASDCSSADRVAALEDERLHSRFGERESRGEPIVSPADDDDVVRHLSPQHP